MVTQRRFSKKQTVRETRSASSLAMAAISGEIDRREFAHALASLNTKLARAMPDEEKGKLLCQVARSLYKRGRFLDAAQAYHVAADLTQSSARDWFKPLLSETMALLKNVSVPEALEIAHRCYRTAVSKCDEFNTRQAGASEEFAQTGRVIVPLKPHRPCVVATELGELFFREGELESAQIFYEKAIAGNPKGGTRARQGLAEIALRSDDPETAFQRSVEAITFGKFQAKTISSWRSYFAAKRKLGQKGLPQEFLAGLRACLPSVRARMLLVIAQELRAGNDPQWKTLASTWLIREAEEFPATAAEFRKMLLAESKRLMEKPTSQLAAAEALLSTPKLAPHEWLAGAKEFVRASLLAKKPPRIPFLVNAGTNLYGESFAHQLQHSLALSCMMAKRHDLARPILQEVIADTTNLKNHVWSKALWALGRMEAFLARHREAAEAFAELADSQEVPIRFRLQARMFWAENLLATGNTIAIEEYASTLPSLLAGVDDFEILLDFARQLSHSNGQFGKIVATIYSMGESKALAAFNEAWHPSQALNILFKLTRRQVYDFGRSHDVLAFWNTLGEQKKLWLWNDDNQWWGYLAFVLMAHLRAGNSDGAREMAQATLSDPATPRAALPTILVPYYEEVIRNGRSPEALEAFRWIITENPTKAGCAAAYYWLALEAHRSGDFPNRNRFADSLLLCNVHTEVTFDRWMYEAKALLLLNSLNKAGLSTKSVSMTPAMWATAESGIQKDLLLVTR